MQNASSLSDSTKLGAVIHFLTIAMKVGKYLPVIVVSFAGVNLLLAVNDFLISNTGFGILNSIFALGGFIFLAQLHQRRKIHAYEYYYNYRKTSNKKIVPNILKGRAMKRKDRAIVVDAGQERENLW